MDTLLISAYFVLQISSKTWVSFVAQTILLRRLPSATFVDLDEVAPSWKKVDLLFWIAIVDLLVWIAIMDLLVWIAIMDLLEADVKVWE